MHFRQKLHEAYEAGYRSGLVEQSPPGSPTSPYRVPEFPRWDQIVGFMEVLTYYPPDQQGPYGLMYDYNGDGAVDQFDLEFARAMAELYPNRVFTAFNQPQGVYQQWFITTYSRPLPPRRIPDPRLSGKMKKKKRMQGPYEPGGGRPFGPGGQGS
tara:strand:+ start:4486 stop:4950 length:465 start_codon:yes stop_codon:yes gene_type:complete